MIENEQANVVPATQDDVEAASAIYQRFGFNGGSHIQHSDRIVQAFARHRTLSAAPPASPDAAAIEREQGPPCENCGKPVEVGQVVLPWDDAGEMHAGCDNPYSISVKRHDGEPEPCLLAGAPMRQIPLNAIRALIDSPHAAETSGTAIPACDCAARFYGDDREAHQLGCAALIPKPSPTATSPAMEEMDQRTGRPFGDHGTANQALEWALDREDDAETFLRAWREGSLDEWPDFYAWLAALPPAQEGNKRDAN